MDYIIDGNNRRVGKKVNGTLKQGFLYQNQLKPIAELDGGSNVVSRFVYGERSNVSDYFIKGGTKYHSIRPPRSWTWVGSQQLSDQHR